MSVGENSSHLTSDAERAGAGIGIVLGMGVLGALWFFPTMGAAGLGFFLHTVPQPEVPPLMVVP